MTPIDLIDARVGTLLGQLGLEQAHRERGVSVVSTDTALILVSCFVAGDEPWVRLSALILEGVDPSLELLHRLLQLNQGALLGAFQLFEDGTVALSHTLHGHAVDAETFGSTLRYLAHTADRVGPELQALAGGTPGVRALGRTPSCGSSPS